MPGERPTFPSERALLDAREEAHDLGQHVAYPGRVQSYDAATQTADVVPLIRQQVPQPDGSYALEALPVLPSVPVVFPRVGAWFLAFALEPGDTVQLLCNTSAIGHWRAGDGNVTDPGDLRRQHLSHAVALPGLYTRGRALGHAPAGGTGLVLGSDAGDGTRVSVRADGGLTITRGADVALAIDADGTVHVGGAAGDFLALANLVSARLDTIQRAFDLHTHAGVTTGTGVSAAPATPIGPLAAVAATKAKGT